MSMRDQTSTLWALSLYELLAGKTPLDIERATDEAARRRPVAWHVTPPSRISSSILTTKTQRRDLDAIVLKALEPKSPQRYPSAAALADDVQRHLNDKPVEASQNSWTYVMEKFTRRHRTLVVMSAVALLAIIAGFGASTILYFKEQHARAVADARREQVEERERELSRALSRADFKAAQNYKREADYQSAAAALVRSLQSDPTFAAAGADLQTLLAYSELPGPIAAPLPIHPAWGEVKRGAVTADGRSIVAVMENKAAEKRLFLFEYHDAAWDSRELAIPHGIVQLGISGRGKFIAFIDSESTVNVIDLSGEVLPARQWKAPAQVSHLVIETRLSRAIVGCANGTVWSVSADPNDAPLMLFNTGSRIERLITGSGQLGVIAGCSDGTVWRWRPAPPGTGATVLLKLPGAITALSQAGNGQRIAAGDALGNAALRGPSSGEMPASRHLHFERITAIAIAGDEGLVTAGRELSVRWTNMTAGTNVATAAGLSGPD